MQIAKYKINALIKICIVTAFSGIASTLLIEGRTLHNAFKSPIPILETSVANVTANSVHGHYLNSALLIIIDEISMCPVEVFKIIDWLYRNFANEDANKNKPFGVKTVLWSGNFR